MTSWSESFGVGAVGRFDGVPIVRSELLPFGEVLRVPDPVSFGEPGLPHRHMLVVGTVRTPLEAQLDGARRDAIAIVHRGLAEFGTPEVHAAAWRRLEALELLDRMAGVA